MDVDDMIYGIKVGFGIAVGCLSVAFVVGCLEKDRAVLLTISSQTSNSETLTPFKPERIDQAQTARRSSAQSLRGP